MHMGISHALARAHALQGDRRFAIQTSLVAAPHGGARKLARSIMDAASWSSENLMLKLAHVYPCHHSTNDSTRSASNWRGMGGTSESL
ncbi:hypothetical protein FKM82_022883 [Ascaphus truei]